MIATVTTAFTVLPRFTASSYEEVPPVGCLIDSACPTLSTPVVASIEIAQTFGFHPIFRAAVTGFGLVHLVWGAHDLDELIFRRRLRAP